MTYFRTEYDWSKVEDPITDEEVRLWIETLRSKKYRQGKEGLVVEAFDEDDSKSTGDYCYCCLGVLKQIVPAKPNNDESYLFEGIYDVNKLIGAKWESKLPYKLQDQLAKWNDNSHTFEDIAFNLEKGFFSEPE